MSDPEPGGTPALDPPTRARALLLAGHRHYRAGGRADPWAAPSGRGDFVAAVLTCAEPQPPAADLFGGVELFTVHTAGLRLGPAVLGSLEYAVDQLHLPLVVVLGHTRCGLPGAGGPAHVRATLAALRRDSRALDAAVAAGRCALVGMCRYDERDQVHSVLPAATPTRRHAPLRPPSRRSVRAR
jgi:hypothetical protein